MDRMRKYNTATHVYIPMVKRAVVDHAVGADWTPAAGDVKISKDGGAAANVTNLPTAIAMGNSALWDFSLTATELAAAKVVVTIADSATKAVEDNAFSIITFGNASAEIVQDISASIAQTGDAGSLVSKFTGITRLSHWLGALAGKQAADATAQTELRASGAGSGTFDPTTDSLESLRDNLATATALATVQSDTDDIQTRIPTALAADGTMKSSIFGFLGTAFTEGAAGRFAANVKTFFNIASATGTQDVIPTVTTTTTATNLTNAPPDSAGVTTLLTRIPSALFAGITSMAHWLGMLAGKQTANTTALSEIKATGAGSGTYDPTTDSLEANRDNIGTAGAGLTAADDAVISAVAALNNLSAAQVNAEVVDALNVDTYAEPAQGAPPAAPTIRQMMHYPFKAWRNKKTQTATTLSIFADDASTVDHKATVSDDGTTATVGEVASGP